MAVSNVVLRGGVGPTATIPYFVTHGLGNFGGPTPTPTPTGGHFIPDRHKIKRQQEALEARQAEKLEQAKTLRRQIEEAIRPEVEEKHPESPKKAKKQAKIIALKQDNLAQLEKELLLLQQQIELANIEAKRIRDEEDIQVILMALNAPFEELLGIKKTIQ